VATVIRRYRLSAADAEDVSQIVWQRVVTHLNRLGDPAALPRWLVAITHHECQRYLWRNSRSLAAEPDRIAQADGGAEEAGDETGRSVIAAELTQLAQLARRLLWSGTAEHLGDDARELLMAERAVMARRPKDAAGAAVTSQVVWQPAPSTVGDTLQVAYVDDLVGLRDAAEPDGPLMVFTRTEWEAFLRDGDQRPAGDYPADTTAGSGSVPSGGRRGH
jgi:DNA-directed RNA polymerase specialized sigma24 family protein